MSVDRNKMWDSPFPKKGNGAGMIDLSFSLDFDAELIREDIRVPSLTAKASWKQAC